MSSKSNNASNVASKANHPSNANNPNNASNVANNVNNFNINAFIAELESENAMVYNNNITPVIHSNNISQLDETPKIMTKNCIAWATKYFADTPYLYEIRDDTGYIKQKVKPRKTKKKEPGTNGTIPATNSNMTSYTRRRTVNSNKTSISQGIDFKFSINDDIYNIIDSTINSSNTRTNATTNTNARLTRNASNTRTNARKKTLNIFVKTTQFLLRYSLYLLNFIEKQDNTGIPSEPCTNFLEYINSDPEFRSELSKLRRANAYELSDYYKKVFYDKFISTAINAYKTSDEFIALGGTTYLTSIHGKPIIRTRYNPLFFEVPKDCKIALLTPLNTYGVKNMDNNAQHDLSYLARGVGYNNIIKLGPNYYQNINNNVPFQLLNMNIYHEGQMIPNLELGFNFSIIISSNDTHADFNKYNENSIESSTSVMHYFYNMLIKMLIQREHDTPSNATKIFTKYTNNSNKPNIFFKPDKTHLLIDMILQDVSLFSTEKQKQINDIFTNKKLYNDDNKQISDEIISIVSKTLTILSNFTITYSESSEYNIYMSTSMDKYIKHIDDEFPKKGNLYLFNACRHYNADIVDKLFNKSYINYQLAMTYVTNIVNKYISSLINSKPEEVDMKDYTGNLYTSHSISNKVCNKLNVKDIKNNIVTQPNTMYYHMAMDISKDYMILLAISNFIIYSLLIKFDDVYKFNNIKIVLYNLFIKPKRKDKFLLSHRKKMIINEKTINIPKETIKNKVMHIIRSKLKLFNQQNMDIIIKKITKYIMIYYLPYLNWIKDNSVLSLNKWNDNSVNNNTQKLDATMHLIFCTNIWDTVYGISNNNE